MKSVNKNLNILIGKRIAHRGLWCGKFPENSLGAFERCVDKCIPIELDVHILKDGKIQKSGGMELALEIEKNGYSNVGDDAHE